jgi:hypothetical protein
MEQIELNCLIKFPNFNIKLNKNLFKNHVFIYKEKNNSSVYFEFCVENISDQLELKQMIEFL